MRKLLISLVSLFPFLAPAQTLDTIISVGYGQELHFTIIKGIGAPILFESGLGNGADVWKNITKQITDVTDATIITYDRLSYGQDPKVYEVGFETELKAVEAGLQKLGYANKNIMLVAHSLGGMYASYYASRHAEYVKAVVLIDDANICSLTSYFNMPTTDKNEIINKYISEILATVIKNPMPKNIPLTDILAVDHTDEQGNLDSIWSDCHKRFVAESSTRKLISAYGVGHAIFADNPPLVINTIITLYAEALAPKHKAIILEKAYKQALEMANESKRNEVKCGHSEDDLTTWGYSFLEKGNTEKAIEVFKLNVLLYPEGWNTYDCLGEAYLKAGNKELAIKNYKKSLDLNPKNDNASKVLGQIQK